jgi:hypothetical protein
MGSSQLEIDIARKMYACWPVRRENEAGRIACTCVKSMGNDRGLFTEDAAGPRLRGRMVWQFDHRAKLINLAAGAADWLDLEWSNPRKAIVPQWFIPAPPYPRRPRSRRWLPRWILRCYRPTNERSLVAAIIRQMSCVGTRYQPLRSARRIRQTAPLDRRCQFIRSRFPCPEKGQSDDVLHRR